MSPRRLATSRFVVGMLFFSSAIASLWIGLTNGQAIVRITGWYIGAIVLAILGILVLGFPTSKGEKETK